MNQELILILKSLCNIEDYSIRRIICTVILVKPNEIGCEQVSCSNCYFVRTGPVKHEYKLKIRETIENFKTI